MMSWLNSIVDFCRGFLNRNEIRGGSRISEIGKQSLHTRIHLEHKGFEASIYIAPNERVPLLLLDIQRYLMLPLLGPDQFAYFTCDWINIEQREKLTRSIVIIVDGIGLTDYMENEDKFQNFTNGFKESGTIVLGTDSETLINVLSTLPLIQICKYDLVQKYGCMEVCLQQLNDPNAMLKLIFPTKGKHRNKANKSFNRITLLLSASQMQSERYPVPIPIKKEEKYSDYVFTKDTYSPVTESSPMFGLDCERCMTWGGSELYRVSIVDENGNVFYNSYVLPDFPISGNRNMFSGLNRSELLEVTTKRRDVQRDLRNILPADAILIGQSLNYDLDALKMMHPYVINTSCIYNSSGSRSWKSKLREFTFDYLDRRIQNKSTGHCSIEDAKAALDLVKLKLENTAQFGDVILQQHKSRHQRDKNIRDLNNAYNQPILIGKRHVLEKYVKSIKMYSDSDNCIKHMNMVPCKSLKDIYSKTNELAKDHKLIMTHIDLAITDEEDILEFDDFVKYVWNNNSRETLISILLTGTLDYNGVLFYNIKKKE